MSMTVFLILLVLATISGNFGFALGLLFVFF